MKYRAKQMASAWKVERLEPSCAKCGDGQRWRTILYTYVVLDRDEQEADESPLGRTEKCGEGSQVRRRVAGDRCPRRATPGRVRRTGGGLRRGGEPQRAKERPTMSERIGSYATCAVCGRHKNPRGRSAPMEMANSLCHSSECEGWDQPPYAGDLWPGETADEFGFPCQTTEERNHE